MKKKLMTLLLAVTMALAVPMTALATETTSTTQMTREDDDSKVEHTYEVYAIFTGTYSSGTLSDVVWATNSDVAKEAIADAVLGDAEGTDYYPPADGATDTTLSDILTTLAEESDNSDKAKAVAAAAAKQAIAGNLTKQTLTADADGNIMVSTPGYYVVVDVTGGTDLGQDTANYAVLTTTNGVINITEKNSSVESHKYVADINDSTDSAPTSITGYTYGTDADWEIGDSVPFKLTGTVPTDYNNFTSFYYCFHDEMSTGLTFNNDVKVYVGTTEITSYFTTETSITDCDSDANGTNCTFHIYCADLKKVSSVVAGSTITVYYTATLNTDANIGSTGNPNKSNLEFSNIYSDTNSKGKTPWEDVIVFTYQTVINKVDAEKNALAGAEFTLYKEDKNYAGTDNTDTSSKYNREIGKTTIGVKVTSPDTDPTTFTFKGIDDGNYILVETKTPNGYNSISPIEFTVTGTHSNKTLSSLTGNVTTGVITFTASNAEGVLTTSVENKMGSILPSTGGIGTTIFYVIGGILIVGAGVLLFVKARTKKK